MLRKAVGWACLGLSAALAALWWAPGVGAQTTQPLTVTGTVAAVNGITGTASSVAFASGAPNSSSQVSSATCVTLTSNTGAQWALAFRPASTSFTATGGGSFATSNLHWRINGGSTYTPASSTGNVTVGTGGRNLCLDLELVYPDGTPAGDYSATFNLIVS